MKKILPLILIAFLQATLSAGNEAQEFFREAKRLYNHENKTAAFAKIDSAIALEPENREFIAQKLEWQFQEFTPETKLSEYIAILEAMYENNFDITCLISRSLTNPNLCKAWQHSQENEKKQLATFCDKYRKYWIEKQKIRYGADKKPETIHELKQHGEYYHYNSCSSDLFYDVDAYKKNKLEMSLEFLKIMESFFREHPEMIPDFQDNIWLPCYGIDMNDLTNRSTYDDITGKRIGYTLPELKEYIEYAKQHIIPSVRAAGLIIELYARTDANNYDPEKFRSDFTYFAQEFARIGYMDKKDLFNGWCSWSGHFKKYPALAQIANEIDTRYNPPPPKSEAEIFMDQLRSIKKKEDIPAFVIANKDKCLRFEEELRNYRSSPDTVGDFAYTLVRLYKNDNIKQAEKALSIFNRQMKIEDLFIRNENQYYSYEDGIIMGKELLMVKHYIPDMFAIEALNLENFTMKELFTYKTKLDERCRNFTSSGGKGYPIDCDGNILVLGAEDAIHVFKMDGSGTRTITDLPDPEVNALALMNGRIYAWCGMKQSSQWIGGMLFSCDLEGHDRKYHFNSKTESFNLTFPYNSRGMLPDRPRNRLLLLSYSGLYEFKLDDEAWKLLMPTPKKASTWGSDSFCMQRLDNQYIYVSLGGGLMLFNPEDDSYEWYCCGSPKYKNMAKYHYSEKYLLGSEYFGPFYSSDKYLWIRNCGQILCWKKGPGEMKRLYFYPQYKDKSNCGFDAFFPAADGKSVVVIRGGDIMKFTPQEETK